MHEGHRKRIREKYKLTGLESFADHEILELLLFYSNKRSDTNETAHKLIERFGSLSAVFEASYDELLSVDGIGDVAATLITMIPELFRKYRQDKASNIIEINSYNDALEYLRPRFFGLTEEKAALLCLDIQNRVNNLVFLSDGSLNIAQVDVRKAVQLALNCNSHSVILVHNHPFGVAAPSRTDLETTQTIVNAFKAINIKVADHIIVSDTDDFSMKNTDRFSFLFT